MMEPRLRNQLAALEKLLRQTRSWRELAFGWAAAAAAGALMLLVQGVTGWNSRIAWLLPLLCGTVALGIVWKLNRRRTEDLQALVTIMERDYPDLRHALSAATEQEPHPDSGRFGFLQLRLIEEMLAHPRRGLWREMLERKLSAAKNAHAAALSAFLAVGCVLACSSAREQPLLSAWMANGITVTPGDTQVERGTRLVVSARFRRKPPLEATLILVSASGGNKRLPMARPFTDPVFGAALPELAEDGLYRIESGTQRTRDYTIRVFDYPALVRADASLRYPDYTGLTNTTIRDTRRISAVEGTRLTYSLQLNTPVSQARFAGAGQLLTLSIQSNAIVSLNDLLLTNSARYSLELVDAEGRTNKLPADFAIQVLPDRRPELKLVFPRGDQRVSCLQELQLQAEASDDFGLLKYGVGFGMAGQEPRFIELGQSAPGNQKRQFGYVIPLEQLGAEADQLITYFLWADDYGPDGQVRRTLSDVFFAEVRPFEEVFRPDQSGMEGGGNQAQQGDQRTRLAELQKDIVIATWKLQQERGISTTRSP